MLLGDNLWGDYGSRYNPYPADYVVLFEDEVVDTSMQLGWPSGPFGRPEIPAPFRIWNNTEQRYSHFGIVERLHDGESSYDHIWQPDEPIIILYGDSAGVAPEYPNYNVTWAIRLFLPESVTPIAPTGGDVITINTTKPFRNNERIIFKTIGASIDIAEAKEGMENVYVVPNPYVATSIFEPSYHPWTTWIWRRRTPNDSL